MLRKHAYFPDFRCFYYKRIPELYSRIILKGDSNYTARKTRGGESSKLSASGSSNVLLKLGFPALRQVVVAHYIALYSFQLLIFRSAISSEQKARMNFEARRALVSSGMPKSMAVRRIL